MEDPRIKEMERSLRRETQQQLKEAKRRNYDNLPPPWREKFRKQNEGLIRQLERLLKKLER